MLCCIYRSRLRKKNDKKIQQQFFEQKRQEKRYGIKRKFSPKKTEGFSISQDMLSLQTVLKAHDSDLKKKGIISFIFVSLLYQRPYQIFK